MKQFAGLLTVGLFVFGMGLAQEETQGMAYSDYDTDASGGIDISEFGNSFSTSGLYSRFDADSGGAVSEEEFAKGVFAIFDADSSGTLTEEELTPESMAGLGVTIEARTELTFQDFDVDANNEVSPEEFAQTYDAGDQFGVFDADANAEINEAEFSEGVFGFADANADEMISEEEFNTNERWFNFQQSSSESSGTEMGGETGGETGGSETGGG